MVKGKLVVSLKLVAEQLLLSLSLNVSELVVSLKFVAEQRLKVSLL